MSLRKKFSKGEVVFHEGNPSDDAYIIGLGSVETLENTASRQKVMEIPGENEIFGELGLIDGLPRLATARAREDSVVYVLTPQTFDNLVQENPETLLPIL